MNIIKEFGSFSKETLLFEECIEFIHSGSLNESNFMDKIKNSLSKNLLGSLSYIKMIDDLYDKIISLEKEKIEKEYDFEDAVDDIEAKIDSSRYSTSGSGVKDLIRQRERKIKEMETYMDSQNLKIKKGKDLIAKAIKGNPRRSEYSKVKSSDFESKLADYRYEVAKKKSSPSEDLKKLKDSSTKADKKAKEKSETFYAEFKKKQEGSVKIPKIEPIKSETEKKIINSRDPKDLIERKEELEIKIAKTRSAIERSLDSISSSDAKDSPMEKKQIESLKIKLLDLSNTFDSSVNLLKLYREMGKSKDSVSKKLGSESTFTELSNKINSSISDGNDANSGVTKYIMNLFNNSDGKNLASNAGKTKEKIFKK